MSFLKKFHNNIKKQFLLKYARSSLLDLGSGKAGDLWKWISIPTIQKVVGYDINEEHIKEANNRVLKANIINKKRKLKIQFFQKDLSKDVVVCNQSYDMIISNFSFHYFFKSYRTLNTILRSIDSCSKDGTILIISTINANNLPDKKVDNSLFHYTPLSQTKNKNIGNKIEISLHDSILEEHNIEYKVYPSYLIKKLKSINFNCIESVPFSELYKNSNFSLSPLEQEWSFLNHMFVFIKEL